VTDTRRELLDQQLRGPGLGPLDLLNDEGLLKLNMNCRSSLHPGAAWIPFCAGLQPSLGFAELKQTA